MNDGYNLIAILFICITITMVYERNQWRKTWEAYYRRPMTNGEEHKPPGSKSSKSKDEKEEEEDNEDS